MGWGESNICNHDIWYGLVAIVAEDKVCEGIRDGSAVSGDSEGPVASGECCRCGSRCWCLGCSLCGLGRCHNSSCWLEDS